LTVAAPVLEALSGPDVVFAAVRVDHGYDPHFTGTHDLCHALLELRIDLRRIAAVVVGQQVDDAQRLLHGEMLAPVAERLEQDLWLVLVLVDVVADLDRPDGAPLMALANGPPRDYVRT
jgi:hypothetical protein